MGCWMLLPPITKNSTFCGLLSIQKIIASDTSGQSFVAICIYGVWKAELNSNFNEKGHFEENTLIFDKLSTRSTPKVEFFQFQTPSAGCDPRLWKKWYWDPLARGPYRATIKNYGFSGLIIARIIHFGNFRSPHFQFESLYSYSTLANRYLRYKVLSWSFCMVFDIRKVLKRIVNFQNHRDF